MAGESGELPVNQSKEEQAKEKPASPPTSARWLNEIKAAEKHVENFWKQGDLINKRYLDKRGDEAGEDKVSKLNLFTTNTNILFSTLYAKFPKPAVKNEFGDFEDDVSRVAGMILERMLRIKKNDDYDAAMKSVVQDRLVPGLGQVWFRYEPTIVKETVPATTITQSDGTQVEVSKAFEYDRLVNEAVVTDYVFWKDFLWSPCRRWVDNRWVARRLKMAKEEVETRFGKLIADRLAYTTNTLDGSTDKQKDVEGELVKYAEIWEIWDKRSKKLYWVCKGFEYCLDVKDDPFQLDNFFPCPPPLKALTSTTDQVPRADFLMVQDQYNELDSINNRITVLERAVKVVGVYDGNSEELKRIFSEQVENELIPLTGSFKRFAEGGGFKGMIDWVPIEAVLKALEVLRSYRQDLISQIYELTGISDIMRGASKASETLGAQQLKAQYGGVRLQFMQMDTAEFVEEALSIKGQIIIRKFQPQTILARSNIENTPDKDTAQEALKLMKDPLFKFRVEVRADSMAVPEFNAERDARMDFMRATSEMFTAAAPLLEQAPKAGIVILQIIQWAASGFRVGRDIEGLLDKAIKEMVMQVNNPPPPAPPPPNVVAAANKDDASAGKMAAETQGINIDNAVKLMGPMPTPPAPPRLDGPPKL